MISSKQDHSIRLTEVESIKWKLSGEVDWEDETDTATIAEFPAKLEQLSKLVGKDLKELWHDEIISMELFGRYVRAEEEVHLYFQVEEEFQQGLRDLLENPVIVVEGSLEKDDFEKSLIARIILDKTNIGRIPNVSLPLLENSDAIPVEIKSFSVTLEWEGWKMFNCHVNTLEELFFHEASKDLAVLNVDGEQVDCHSLILAVHNRVLSDLVFQKSSVQLQISSECLFHLLRYLYGMGISSYDLMDEVLRVELFQTAQKYQLKDLEDQLGLSSVEPFAYVVRDFKFFCDEMMGESDDVNSYEVHKFSLDDLKPRLISEKDELYGVSAPPADQDYFEAMLLFIAGDLSSVTDSVIKVLLKHDPETKRVYFQIEVDENFRQSLCGILRRPVLLFNFGVELYKGGEFRAEFDIEVNLAETYFGDSQDTILELPKQLLKLNCNGIIIWERVLKCSYADTLLKKLLPLEATKDFTIVAEDGDIKCHRFILAAHCHSLEAFTTLNENDMETEDILALPETRLEMKDLTKSDVTHLIRFLYNLDVPTHQFTCEVAFRLFRAAVNYQLPEVVKGLSQLLMDRKHEWFNPDCALQIYFLAKDKNFEDSEFLVSRMLLLMKILSDELRFCKTFQDLDKDDAIDLLFKLVQI